MDALGRIRAIVLTIVFSAIALPGVSFAVDGPAYVKLAPGDILDGRPVYLGINKSVVIDLPKPAGDVLVSNPKIADAVLRTSTRLYLIGVDLGQASVFLFDSAGGQIASFNIYVEADLGALNQLLAEAITDGYVRAEALNGSIVLRGQVPSSVEAARAVELTSKMIAAQPTSITSGSSSGNGSGSTSSTSQSQTFNPSDGPGIINLLTITGEEQVALKVSVVEVQRSVIKQLGINLKGVFVDGVANNGPFGIGTNLVSALGVVANGSGGSPITFPINSGTTPGEVGAKYTSNGDTVQATLKALEQTSMLRTLAEPTLTAVSGETANFLAGGEFPVPVAGDNGQISVQFKQFGVNLAFTPVVLSAGRISLKMRTEVSDLSATGAVSVPISSTATVTIPATSVRRAETSIELPSGGAFMIAGLIQDDTRRAATGLPWLQKLPILGALFSSKDFLSDQTELVMIVTAYLVKPVSPEELARPDDNLFMANDAEAYFLNRLTKVYGAKGKVPSGTGAPQVGFTFD
jgi:pilus assembly protein CpaC